MINRTFRTIRKKLAPSWLTTGAGELVGYSLDLIKDAFMERVRLGKLAHFPRQNPAGDPAPTDALVEMGKDRRIFRGIFDTDRTYAEKLIPWLDKHVTDGSAFRLMKSLAEYCGPLPSFRTVDDRGNWYSRAADGTETYLLDQRNWNWDGRRVDPDNAALGGTWSRFWVIIYPNGLWTEGDGGWNHVDEEPWGETANADETPLGWGATITTEQVATLRAIVKDEMPGGTRCVNIILAFDPDSFDPTAPEPDGTWGRFGKVIRAGGVSNSLQQVPSRLSTARYLDGV
jgi:hypothetical protein